MVTKRRSRGKKKASRGRKPAKRRAAAREDEAASEDAARGLWTGRTARALRPLYAIDHPRPGSRGGGQSGDTEGLSQAEIADSESVEELIEEGQAFEAGIVSGVENARDADQGGVRTRQVPEDDVPQEYLDED